LEKAVNFVVPARRPHSALLVFAVAIVVLLTALVAVASSANAADVLLSRGKPTSASSTESSAHSSDRAVDGNTTTRWASVEGSDPQWITVDLGSVNSISRVKLVWEAAYGKAYRLEVSGDGTAWTTLKSVTGENGGTDDHTGLTGTGRYLRLYGTQRGTSYGYSLWELEVYGAGSTDTTAPSVPGNLRSTGVTSSTIALAWDPATDNVAVTGYDVFRSGVKVTTATGTTYTDTGLAGSTSYTYTVQARDGAGNVSAASAPVTATTSASSGTVDYQAELATLSQAAVATNHTGYSGTGFVDYTNIAGGYIEWTVNVAAAGSQSVAIRYANGTTVNRPMDISVNGAVSSAGLAFGATTNWDTWADRTLTVTLTAGANTIRATATTANGGPNVDKITIGTPPATTSFVVAAAGDIAEQCTASSTSCIHPKTAAQVQAMNPQFVITMGDNQYDDARLSDFQNYFDSSWGRFKSKMHPAPGNHETYDPAGSMVGYQSYFGAIAYPQGKAYYSYDYGNWHFIALDSNAFDQSAQLTWLRNDLAANSKGCIATYWHHPLFSSGEHGNDPVSKPVWQLLYNAHADLILNGHDHHYERFGPQNPNAAADPNGLVELLGGMGGASPYQIVNVQPNSQKRLVNTFGVVKLSFTDSTYSWQLIGIDGAVKDTSPTYACH
jgi:chitodextrinase